MPDKNNHDDDSYATLGLSLGPGFGIALGITFGVLLTI